MISTSGFVIILIVWSLKACNAHPMMNHRLGFSSSSVSHPIAEASKQHSLYESLIDEEKEVISTAEAKERAKTKLTEWFQGHRQQAQPLVHDMLVNYLEVLKTEEVYDRAHERFVRNGPRVWIGHLSRFNDRYKDVVAATTCNAQTLQTLANNANHFPIAMKKLTKDRKKNLQYMEMVKYENDLVKIAQWANDPLSYKLEPLMEGGAMTKAQICLRKTRNQIALVQQLIKDYQPVNLPDSHTLS